MNEIAVFFSMGGYWAFVWPCYAISAAALTAAAVWSWRGMKRAEAEIAALTGEAQERRARRAAT